MYVVVDLECPMFRRITFRVVITSFERGAFTLVRPSLPRPSEDAILCGTGRSSGSNMQVVSCYVRIILTAFLMLVRAGRGGHIDSGSTSRLMTRRRRNK